MEIIENDNIEPDRYETAKASMDKLASPGTQATQKSQLEYLWKMISALTISLHAYVVKTEKKLAEIGDSYKENAKTLDIKVAAEIDKVRSQLNIDIGLLTTRCEVIERKVENIESRFSLTLRLQ